MHIRSCIPQDVPAICAIYNHYIENTVITFEEIPLSVEQMRGRIEGYMQLFPWLVCEDAGEIIGYAYASKWKDRSAYKHTAEVTVYLHHKHVGKGVGRALYQELIDQLAARKMHVLLACIAVPNAASEKLHEHFGFNKVAHFTEVGFKFNRWLDVGYWQKLL
ncbi:MAG TPA: arsinothricin resistance N-acetyltransferase ArsN1 family B [Cellvibrio sp.]|nr:arsinothricin resistance N-acetyltransferase ArsN1 family B [Cellvibrio sp.]